MASSLDKLKTRTGNLLRSIEPYTKTDMVYLAKGSFWLGIGQFVSSLSVFLTSIAFANLLSPDAYGIYKYIISINALLLITTLTGMDSAVTQSVARGFEGTLKVGVREKMKWGVFGTIASFIIALYYFFQGNMILALGFSITAVFVPFFESYDMYNSLLWGKKLFDIQTKYNIIKKLISLVSIIAVIFITQNLYIILLTYFLSITIPNIFFYYRTERLYKNNNSIDPESLSYGKNLSTINIIGLLLSELDKILVFQFIGASNLAIYSLALAPTDQIKGLLKNVNSLAMPKLSSKNISQVKNDILYKVFILGVSTTIIVLIYILIAPLFFKIFFPNYLDSVYYSQLLSLSVISAVIAGFIYTILESQKATEEVRDYNIYGNLFNILTITIFIFKFGMMGAVISRILSRLFFALYGLFLVKRMNAKYSNN